MIMDMFHRFLHKLAFLGPHCLILPGVRVGEGAVVKGGSVITSNVPPFTFWGSPAAGPHGTWLNKK